MHSVHVRASRLLALLFIVYGTHASVLRAQVTAPSPADAQVTEPALIPAQSDFIAQKCRHKRNEEVQLDVLINSSGTPVQYYFHTAHGDEGDLIALRTVASDRFRPATRSGQPLQVKRTITIRMPLCTEKYKASDGTKSERLSPAGPPDQIIQPADNQMPNAGAEILNPDSDTSRPFLVGGGVSQPRPLVTPEAHYSLIARKARLQGTCVIRLIVDEHGAPQNPQIAKPLGMGLDEEALDAVQHYRFHPAMKGGQIAVPVIITVEVNFALY